jgi:hypothetical protein
MGLILSGVELQGPTLLAGAQTFLELTDTPSSYAGSGGYYLTVNVTEDGVVFTQSNPTGLQAVEDDPLPVLGGPLNTNGYDIFTSTGTNQDIVIAPDGTGEVIMGGLGQPGILSSDTAQPLTVEADTVLTLQSLGDVVIQGLTWPNVDGIAGQALTTDGSGNLQWGAGGTYLTAVVDDPSPQLGGNLDVNGHNIVSVTANQDIKIIPNGNGSVIIGSTPVPGKIKANVGQSLFLNADGDLLIQNNVYPKVFGTAGQVLTTNGIGVLYWSTPSGGTGNVTSVFGRTGVVVAEAGDYSAFYLEDLVDDTTPQLGGNLDVNGSAIITAPGSGADINLIPDNGGEVIFGNTGAPAVLSTDVGQSLYIDPDVDLILLGQTWPSTDGTAGQVLSTDGSGNLSWITGGGGGSGWDGVSGASPALGGNLTTDGFALITSPGSNADVTIIPDGTGALSIGTPGAAGVISSAAGESLTIESGADISLIPDTAGTVIVGNAGADGVIESDVGQALYVQSDTSLFLNNQEWPLADGTVGQALTTDGAGTLSWTTISAGGAVDSVFGRTGVVVAEVGDYSAFYLQDVVDDTTPQLGGDLDVNGFSIVTAAGSDADINLVPDGLGAVVCGFSGNGAIVSDPGENLSITAGATLILQNLAWPSADGAANNALVTDGLGTLSFAAIATAAQGALADTSLQPVDRIYVNVKDFGATGNGSTDDRAAIQTAINSVSATGGTVFFPTGTYNIGAELDVDYFGIHLLGAGVDATVIRNTSTTAHSFNVGDNIRYISIDSMSITSSVTKTAGAGIYSDAASNGQYQRLRIDKHTYGIHITNAVVLAITDVEINDTVFVAANSACIRIDAGNDIFVTRVVTDNTGTEPYAGCWIRGTGAVWMTDCDFIKSGHGMLMTADLGEISWCFVNQCAFDSSVSGHGIYIAGGDNAIKGCNFSDCWTASNGGSGIFIEQYGTGSIDGIQILGHRSYNNTVDGYTVANSVVGVTLPVNVTIDASVASGNSNNGVAIHKDISDFSIRNGTFRPMSGFSNTQTHGIWIDAGVGDGYMVTNNNVRGNISTGFTDSATGLNKVVGFNLS